MRMRSLCVYVYLLLSAATVLSLNHTLKASRRIGGTRNKAREYPKYVVAVNYWNPIISNYKHVCMGTLLSPKWMISAGHCFRFCNRDYRPSELGIAHGDIFYPDVIQYRVKQFHRHKTSDLAVAETDPINVQLNLLPKLASRDCPADVRAVYHSWGETVQETIFSKDLLFAMTDTNTWACEYPDSKICFEHVDGTAAAKGDSGSGLIVGHGPGPTFDSINHEIRIIGVLSKTFQKAKSGGGMQNFILAERISKYIPWIKQYVKDE